MNEKFITEAIKNDRYLKAARLTEQFEDEIARKLRTFLEQTIEQRSDLFVDDASPSKSQTRVRTEPLAHTRMQADMSRVNNDGENLKFYICIEWTQPEIHGHETEGALCNVHYKIKKLARTDYESVKQQSKSTSEWEDLQFSNQAWKSDRGIFYIPVTNGQEVKEALQTLREHFFAFAEEYGSVDDLV